MHESFNQPEKKQRSPATNLEAFLPTTNKNESGSETASETFSFFKDLLISNGYQEFSSMNEAYSTLPSSQMIVRREDPKNVLKLFSDASVYEVDFVGGDRYSNCVEWNPQTDGPRNISNAYLEGYTNLNSVVTVIGMEKTNDDDITQLEDATQDFHGLNRTGVRSFKGTVSEDRITFINLRIPGHLLTESELTDDEIDRVDEYLELKEAGKDATPVMVHRCFVKQIDADSELLKKAA